MQRNDGVCDVRLSSSLFRKNAFFIAFDSSTCSFLRSVGRQWPLLVAVPFRERFLAWFEHPLQRAKCHQRKYSPGTRRYSALCVEISRSEDVLDVAQGTRILGKYFCLFLPDRFNFSIVNSCLRRINSRRIIVLHKGIPNSFN